ncbi:hypothetical protein FQV39_00560 [Bosea sp. F3-2]|uniref:DUF6778 family protein n=1 Tax=Bosea sp. F3-2 TaxID=2599640 RepID=UPI0011EC50B8|nr:DUF6778 family protein [Bosea sp. F3-2]QEL21230.1 hypothetical protein FQV39_00560 [Bosea sp. F3-2]
MQNPLSQRDVETFRLASIHVETDAAATLWWGDGDRAYARSKGRPETESEELSKTPEARAFVAKLASAKISNALEQQLKPVLNGHRPVKININLRRLYIASAIQRVVVGGGHEMVADIAVVDAKTGAVLLAHPEFRAAALAGQGIGGTMLDAAFLPDPIDRRVQNFATKYRDWLAPQPTA